jgi:PAS domain S-box-containing protein
MFMFDATESWRKIVLENALDAVVGINTLDVVIDWNLKAEEIFGYSKEEAMGMNMASLIIPPEYRQAHAQGISRFLDTGVGPILNKRMELEAIDKSGLIFPVELTVIPVPLGDSYNFYSFVRDISTRKRIEKDLRLKSDVLEYSLNGIDIVDSEGKLIYANQAYLKMWGFNSLEEILGTSPALHCADPKTPELIISALKAHGECDIEFVGQRKDGSHFDVRMLARLAYDSSGQEIYPSTSFDITAQKKDREALEASEEQYHLTFEKAPLGIINTDPSGKLLRVNEKLCQMLGYTREELTSLSFLEITHPDDRASDIKMFKELVNKETVLYDREKRYLRKDGIYLWVKVTGQMLYRAAGSPKHTITIVQDISARKRAEEQKTILEDQISFLSEVTKDLLNEPLGFQERLEKVVNAIIPKLADWCLVDLLNSEGIPYLASAAHINPSKLQLVYELREKYPPAVDRTVGVPNVIKTRKAEIVAEISEELLASIAPDENYLELITSLGLKSYMCVPIEAHGEIQGVITLISEERSYGEADLQFAQELANRAALALHNSKLFDAAHAAIKTRDEFISICSHELNTPLTSMKMNFQLANRLIERQDPRVYQEEAVQKRVRTAMYQIERMTKLISEMLDVSRINYGKYSLSPSKIDLKEILKNAVDRFEEQLEHAKTKLTMHLPNEDVFVFADPFKLEQVFSNLISNSIKYGNGKPIWISLKQNKDRIFISFRDEGLGIEEKNLSRIFNRFERAVSASEVTGLGLGLYITKEIIEAHNGSITVSSVHGQGSEFLVELPVGLK